MSKLKHKNSAYKKFQISDKSIALKRSKTENITLFFEHICLENIPLFLILLFLAWDFFAISRSLPEGVAMPKELIFGLTAAIIPLFMILFKKEIKFNYIDIAFGIMFLLFIPSYFGALDKQWTIFHMLNVIAFFLIYKSSHNLLENSLNKFTSFLMIVFALFFIQSIFQLFSEWNIINWHISGILSYFFVNFHKGATANFNQPNLFAIIIATFLPFFYYKAVKTPYTFLFLFFDIFLLELTHSRAGFLDAFFSMLFLLIFVKFGKSHTYKTILIWILGIVAAFLFEHFLNPSGFTIFNKMNNVISGGTSVRLRVLIWLDAINLFLGHPIFGIGLGNFKSFAILSQADLLSHHEWIRHYFLYAVPPLSHAWAHNEYLHILCETGVVGFSGFMMVIYTILKRGLQVIKKQNKTALILAASLIPYFVHSLFSFPLHFPPTFFLLAVLLGMFASNTDEGEHIWKESIISKIAIAAAAIIIGYLVVTSYRDEMIVASFRNISFWEKGRSHEAKIQLKSALFSPFVGRDAKKVLARIYYIEGTHTKNKDLIEQSLRYLLYRYKIHPHVNTAYMISRIYATLGKFSDSYRWYKQAYLLYPKKEFFKRFPQPFGTAKNR